MSTTAIGGDLDGRVDDYAHTTLAGNLDFQDLDVMTDWKRRVLAELAAESFSVCFVLGDFALDENYTICRINCYYVERRVGTGCSCADGSILLVEFDDLAFPPSARLVSTIRQ